MKTHIVSAPANIALIKYWGKADEKTQWPANDSISMTLENCRTFVKISESSERDSIYFENQLLSETSKQFLFLQTAKKYFNIEKYFTIQTHNNFPSACGIASSASAYAALSFGLASFFQDTHRDLTNLARLGSGSACRSLSPGFVLWQKGETSAKQSVITVASKMRFDDLIVVVSKKEKGISSSAGHHAAQTSPKFLQRLTNVKERIMMLQKALSENNFSAVAELSEKDSEEMHAIAATSQPPIVYQTEETKQILDFVKNERSRGTQIFSTVDAGPNVHILCQPHVTNQVEVLLANKFPQFEILKDTMGQGPRVETDFEKLFFMGSHR